MSSPRVLLNQDSVISHLNSRGVPTGAGATARELSGGVSNIVLSIDLGSERIIVKQSLPKLRVEFEWFAPIERVLLEARAIALMNDLLPNNAPRLLDVDSEIFAIAMSGAPFGWVDWKQRLMASDVIPAVGSLLGSAIGQLHGKTQGGSGLDESFFEEDLFEKLRVEPYFLSSAERVPRLATPILDTVDQLRSRRSCLVHGDFSPKNLLVSPRQDSVWLIDFEVAHYGDPTFDVAFLLTHLMLKAIRTPTSADALDSAAADFISGYQGAVGGSLKIDFLHLIRLIGCLLVARVKGKSRVEYLDVEQQRKVLNLAKAILEGDINTLSELILARTQGES